MRKIPSVLPMGLVNAMYIMRLVICIAVVFGELHMFYPWDVYFGNFYFSWWKTMLSYVILSIITGIIGAILIPLVIHKILSRSRSRNVLNVGIMTFAVLLIIAILFGMCGFTIPNTRVRGIFFAEWKFLIYIFQITFPFSLFAAGLEFIFGKKYAKNIPSKPHFQKDGKFLNL